MVRHVLVIDDEPEIREVTELALHLTAGWTITTAGHGAAGLDLARATAPDCVLLDVMMPGADGFAILRRLRDDPRTRDVPVIFLTAKGTPDMRARSEAAGAQGLIAKPFDPLTLAREIASLLAWEEGVPRGPVPPAAA